MFEGESSSGDPAMPCDTDSPDRGLRPLSWGELVARLAMAQDLRGASHDAQAMRDASFDAGSARRLAARRGGLEIINPDDLVNGKAAGRTVVAGKNRKPATRGNT